MEFERLSSAGIKFSTDILPISSSADRVNVAKYIVPGNG